MSTDASEAPTPTLREVRAALWSTLGRIERGDLKHDVGQVLINGYGSMFKMLVDERNSEWMPRVKELWRERESAKQSAPAVPH